MLSRNNTPNKNALRDNPVSASEGVYLALYQAYDYYFSLCQNQTFERGRKMLSKTFDTIRKFNKSSS